MLGITPQLKFAFRYFFGAGRGGFFEKRGEIGVSRIATKRWRDGNWDHFRCRCGILCPWLD